MAEAIESEKGAGDEPGPVSKPPGHATQPAEMPDFGVAPADDAESEIDLLEDVELNVKIELGRTRMLVEDVLKLGDGSVVELDKLAGDPVDVLVNDRLVARGEVLVLNDNFCVRINEIVSQSGEAIRS
ncbi:MAG: flagellar motor switch protein FliN [Phycisphaerae bacterium]|nr:flagellar motor switch protein FliN [Phycisphaerae bacterium]